VIEALVLMVPGQFVGYNEREVVSHELLASAEAPSVARSADVARAVTAYCSEYPLSMEQHHIDARALRISDFASLRQLHRLDYYDQALKPLGIEHQIRFWVAAPPGIARFYYISRRKEDGDFTDSDRDMLQLLRPFLAAFHERFDSKALQSTNADGLTNRETEILGWVARGEDEPRDRGAADRLPTHGAKTPRARLRETARHFSHSSGSPRVRTIELADPPGLLDEQS
jgi:hypothetical protein